MTAAIVGFVIILSSAMVFLGLAIDNEEAQEGLPAGPFPSPQVQVQEGVFPAKAPPHVRFAP